MPTARPQAKIIKQLNGHKFSASCWGGRWQLTCPDFPDMETKYDGAANMVDALTEFEQRATEDKAKATKETK